MSFAREQLSSAFAYTVNRLIDEEYENCDKKFIILNFENGISRPTNYSKKSWIDIFLENSSCKNSQDQRENIISSITCLKEKILALNGISFKDDHFIIIITDLTTKELTFLLAFFTEIFSHIIIFTKYYHIPHKKCTCQMDCHLPHDICRLKTYGFQDITEIPLQKFYQYYSDSKKFPDFQSTLKPFNIIKFTYQQSSTADPAIRPYLYMQLESEIPLTDPSLNLSLQDKDEIFGNAPNIQYYAYINEDCGRKWTIGGQLIDDKKAMKEIYLYNSYNQWRKTSMQLLNQRYNHTATLIPDAQSIVIIGGKESDDHWATSIELVHIDQHKSFVDIFCCDTLICAASHCAVLVEEISAKNYVRVLIFGGERTNNDSPHAFILTLDLIHLIATVKQIHFTIQLPLNVSYHGQCRHFDESFIHENSWEHLIISSSNTSNQYIFAVSKTSELTIILINLRTFGIFPVELFQSCEQAYNYQKFSVISAKSIGNDKITFFIQQKLNDNSGFESRILNVKYQFEAHNAIDILRNPTKEQVDFFINVRRPVILRNVYVGSIFERWSLDYLKSALGNALVSVHKAQSRFLDFTIRNFEFQTLYFSEFIDKLKDVDEKYWYYLRSIGDNPRKQVADFFKSYPQIAADLELPTHLFPQLETSLFSSVFRMNSGSGFRLWTHYDIMDNILIQACGYKRVTFFPPNDLPFLDVDGSSSRNVELKASSDFPKFDQTHPMTCILEPGDILFIPSLWFHNVETLETSGPSVAVNVFWKHLSGDTAEHCYVAKDLYGNRDFKQAEEAYSITQKAIDALKSSKMPAWYRDFFKLKLIDMIEKQL